ncbi:glycoside hydrolase domain-containing protein [Kitasatospora sp. MAP5-34]|uniref:glycoside hydrolase domain-containing protein n=1 Tax=Kitasatospora sp. MAP5-34 TaxID=3035102 RepID=UPI00247726C3|nr:glycoside hydrolase domain-containing protein [Kitasatospora sp. MAP5-34]MDH6576290.1 hypothetical protein [Kitasatospora sp. MAP5-34]
MRYLAPAALTAATLVLLLATDHPLREAAADTGTVRTVRLASTAATVPPAARPRTPLPPPTVLPDSPRWPATPGRIFTGAGFDACTAPSLDAMKAWRQYSPYGAVGIYTSGSQRACDQPRLTAAWVRKVRELGWQLLPTHVGLQAPCSTGKSRPGRIDPAKAVAQGRTEAAEAVRGLRALGLGRGSPVYLDIESYPDGDAACAKAVVDFTLGWTQALHGAGYHAGFYSSADSGIRDLDAAARAGASPLPDAVWYARWDDRPGTDGSGYLGAGRWVRHQRTHQNHGDIQETFGGATLTVDRDQLDALVAS